MIWVCVSPFLQTGGNSLSLGWEKGSQELVVVIMGAMLVHPIEMAHLDFYYVAWTYTDHRSENKAFGGRKVRVCAVTTWRVFSLLFMMVFFFFFMYGEFFPLHMPMYLEWVSRMHNNHYWGLILKAKSGSVCEKHYFTLHCSCGD